jgi:hypothetical protein
MPSMSSPTLSTGAAVRIERLLKIVSIEVSLA